MVTVIFADLVGFTARAETLDPEDVAEIRRCPTPAARRARALRRHRREVHRRRGDGCLRRAGRARGRPGAGRPAALAIRDWALEDGGLEVRIAVATGETLVNLDARP